MAQLKDDCFAFGDALTPFADAIADLNDRLETVVGSESVSINDAMGRILAEDIISDRAVPPHDNSAVDGYAVFFDDLNVDGETRLPVTGRVAAGHPLGRDAVRGEAVRIFTGAPMPDHMDTVFMEEDTSLDGDTVVLPVGLKIGSNRRFAGEDVQMGETIIRVGKRLRPQEVGLAASVGRDKVDVFNRLRVAVFSTGDEVRDPGGDAPAGCIYDANRYAVMSLLSGMGCAVTDLGILPDNKDAIIAALDSAKADHDVLMTSGGVSAGEEDHVKSAVEVLGSIHFWRLAIKPGRPIALGQVGDASFIGLPGNPVAAMVTFLMIAQPILRRLSGETDYQPNRFPVVSGFDYKKKSGRREWVRVRIESADDGTVTALKHHSSGAGILTSMVGADGLVEIQEDVVRLGAGEIVTYIPFNGLIAG